MYRRLLLSPTNVEGGGVVAPPAPAEKPAENPASPASGAGAPPAAPPPPPGKQLNMAQRARALFSPQSFSESRLGALETENAALKKQNATLQAENTRLLAIEKEHGEFVHEIEKLEGERETTGRAAARMVANLGMPAAQVPSVDRGDEETKTMPRAEFSKLTPSAQAAFCRRGGKLT